ncbi:MAG: nuclear transport factor 2 family protein [Bacteroidales bacterium]|nr:nuclear transport factor 2 family protein [Bacteroidales bacterium]
MKRTLMIKSIILVLILITTACYNKREEKTDYDNDMILIKQTIHNSIAWAKNKDLNLLYSVIADDTAFLEIHPDNSIVKGISEFREAEKFWMHPDFKAIRYEIKDLTIQISQCGTVAWWFCMLDDINEWKGQPANWENTRWTGVSEKRDGNWVIVQQHFSVAIQ